jgi:hypothetical protein
MMSIAEHLVKVVNSLPEQQAAEILDFAEFLLARQQPSPAKSLTSFIGCLKDSPHFKGDLVAWQREQRNEWP